MNYGHIKRVAQGDRERYSSLSWDEKVDLMHREALIDIIEKQRGGYDKIIDINANNKVTLDARMEIVRIAQENLKLTEE